jgi:hypothetical protein
MPSLTRPRRAATPFRTPIGTPPREISLLRSSVGALDSERARCVHCHRIPLVGEVVHVYEGTGGERHVCELCRSLRREPPARSEPVHSSEHHRAVKPRTRAA